MEKHDRYFQETIKQAPRKAVRTAKKIGQLLRLAKRLAGILKSLFVAIKALLVTLLAGGWVPILIFLLVIVIYVLLLSPVTMHDELQAASEDSTYTGKVMSFLVDVVDGWTEETDREAMEYYKTFEDKCLEGLDEFQELQASQYVLPYTLLMGIDRMDLFQSSLGQDWLPEPDKLYPELKTHYTWEDSEVNYWIQLSYSYDYEYDYNVTHWWSSTDCDGSSSSDSSSSTYSNTGNGSDTAVLTIKNPVKILLEADAFDHTYVYEYSDYITEEDIVTGSGNLTETSTSHKLKSKLDTHGGVLLKNPAVTLAGNESKNNDKNHGHDNNPDDEETNVQEEKKKNTAVIESVTAVTGESLEDYIANCITDIRQQLRQKALTVHGYPSSSSSSGECEDGGSWKDSSGAYISREPYNITFNFDYTVDKAIKYYKPLEDVQVQGEPFERLFEVTNRIFGKVAPLDVEVMFFVATEYDKSFGYNFAANNAGYINLAGPTKINYGGSLDLGALAWPVSRQGTYITSKFGYRNAVYDEAGRVISPGGLHSGIDIGSGGRNIPVHTASKGVVTFAGLNGSLSKGYGRTVIIDHGQNDSNQKMVTLYAHLDSIKVSVGDMVNAGDIIGIMGTTGSSNGIHLHFEVRLDNKKVDPLQYFPGVL